MHTAAISRADRAALENLWGDAGAWAADTWTRLKNDHFDGKLRYHGIVWGLTPHGGRRRQGVPGLGAGQDHRADQQAGLVAGAL